MVASLSAPNDRAAGRVAGVRRALHHEVDASLVVRESTAAPRVDPGGSGGSG